MKDLKAYSYCISVATEREREREAGDESSVAEQVRASEFICGPNK